MSEKTGRYTNGPWEVDEHLYANGTIWGPDAMPVCTVEDRGGEMRSNANLIAAAPDLLEALRDIVNLADSIGAFASWPAMKIHEARGRITAAKAVLAKAEQ